MDKSRQSLRDGYISALPGPLAYAPSFLVPLVTGLSIFGAANGHHLLHDLQQGSTAELGMGGVMLDTLLSFTCPLLILGGAGALDVILGPDPRPSVPVEASDGVYKAMLYAHVLLHWLLLVSSCAAAGAAGMHPAALLGVTVSLGVEGTLVLAALHELAHSPLQADRRFAALGYAPFAYMHFSTAHLRHHRRAGLPDDNQTARLGESIYHFFARSTVDDWRESVAAELSRLRRRRLPILCLQNRLFQWAGCPLALLACAYQSFGQTAAGLAAAQAALSVFLGAAAMYVAHYGLRRECLASGRWEPVDASHSWDANWLFTNGVFINAQRHSDHHADACKPYQQMEVLAEASTLPASWLVMSLLALLPGIFFDIMDPLALEVAARKAQQQPLTRQEEAKRARSQC